MHSMTTLYYLRHAESEMNLKAAELVGGRSNHAELSPEGKRQRALVGRWLLTHEISPDITIASPAMRTIATTIGVLDELLPGVKYTFEIDSRLQELSLGIMEGKPRAEVWTPETVATMKVDPMNFTFPGGDSFTGMQQRMDASYHDFVRQYKDKTILVVGHGLAIRSLAGLFQDWSHAEIMAAAMPNCGLTRIDHVAGNPVVQYVGRDILSEQLVFEAQKV